MLKPWHKIHSEILHKNPWWTYYKDIVAVPDYGEHEYHYVATHGSSMVVALTDDGLLLLVNQFRYLTNNESLEFPCGGIKSEHTPLQTAQFELAEETGFNAAQLEALGTFTPYNGVAQETCYLYLATDLTPTESKPDPTEQFERVQISPDELDNRIRSGTLQDGMTLAAWALAREKVLALTAD